MKLIRNTIQRDSSRYKTRALLSVLSAITVLGACGSGGTDPEPKIAQSEAPQAVASEKGERAKKQESSAVSRRVRVFDSLSLDAGVDGVYRVASGAGTLNFPFSMTSNCQNLAVNHTPLGFGKGYLSGAEYVLRLPPSNEVEDGVQVQVNLKCDDSFDSVGVLVGGLE